MWKKWVAALLCLGLLSCCLTACGKREKVLFLPIDAIATSCDPQIAQGDGLESIANNAFEGLVRTDRSGRILPAAASRWTISPDGFTYTFFLDPDQHWHLTDNMDPTLGEHYQSTFDTSVTADDFVFALQRAVSKGTQAPYAVSLFGIRNAQEIFLGEKKASELGVSAAGPHTLKIELSRPDANFLRTLSTPVCMPCNRQFFQGTNGRYCLSGDLALCNGPYYLSSINTTAGTVLLKKNPDYKGDFKPLSDTLKFVLAKDLGGTSEEETHLGTSSSDATTQDILTSLKSEGGLSAGVVAETETGTLGKQYEVTPYPNKVKVLGFNQKSHLSGNGNFRVAMAAATDPSKINFTIGNPAKGIIPECTDTTSGHPYRQRAGNVVSKPDLNHALQAWNAARGTVVDENGDVISDDDDTTYPVSLYCLTEDRSDAQALVQNWQKVFGTALSVTITSFDQQNELDAALAKGEFDVAYTTLTAYDSIASDFLERFCSDSTDNFLSLEDAAFDQLVAAANSAQTDNDIATGCKQAEQYLISRGYLIPVRADTSCLVTRRSSRDIFVSPAGCLYSVYQAPSSED